MGVLISLHHARKPMCPEQTAPSDSGIHCRGPKTLRLHDALVDVQVTIDAQHVTQGDSRRPFEVCTEGI